MRTRRQAAGFLWWPLDWLLIWRKEAPPAYEAFMCSHGTEGRNSMRWGLYMGDEEQRRCRSLET